MNVFIVGGAGFVGSRIAKAFLDVGHSVEVLDGLLDRTGASRTHIAELVGASFIEARIEDAVQMNVASEK